jgi:hypothetical protein
VNVIPDDPVIDDLLAGMAEPLPDRPPASDRFLALLSELRATPGRASLLTVWTLSSLVLTIACLWQPTVAVQTSLGPARASCGLDVFVYGYPDNVVAGACRHADTGRLSLGLASGLVVLAGLVAMVVFAYRRRAPSSLGPPNVPYLSRLFASPARLVLGALGVVAAILGLLSLRPVPIYLVRSGLLITARCGADNYFGHYPDASIRSACTGAFSGHAHLLEVCVIFVILGVGAMLSVAYSSGEQWRRRRISVVLAVVALGLVSAAFLAPEAVLVTAGPAPVVAECGIDTFVAGYPEYSVESSCRDHYAVRAAGGLSTGAVAVIVAVTGWVIVRRTRLAERAGAIERTAQ